MQRLLCTTMLAIGLFMLSLATPAGVGGEKPSPSPWRTFLNDDVYQDLVKRSLNVIEAAAGSDDKNAVAIIQVEAAVLVGYTFSTNSKSRTYEIRDAALRATDLARAGKLKDLATFSKQVGIRKPEEDFRDIRRYLPATEPMMKRLLTKAKGGEGLHPDLHYIPKVKNLNGIETLLGALANKELSDENAAKMAKELPALAYRLAVMGSITHEYLPKKDVEKWRDYSLTMRDASVALAEASAKKDIDGILKSALAIESSCIDCHSVFKNK